MTPDPNWTAQMDQAIAAMGDTAKIVAAYYAALIAEGVPERAAIHIAARAGAVLLSGGSSETDA